MTGARVGVRGITHQNIIILTDGEKYECWGSLTELCENHQEFSYNYLRGLKYPFKYKGYTFIRIPFRKKLI